MAASIEHLILGNKKWPPFCNEGHLICLSVLSCLSCDTECTCKKCTAIIAAMCTFNQIFRMRHHAENVAACIDDTSDIVDGTVRICAVCIAEHNLTFTFDTL